MYIKPLLLLSAALSKAAALPVQAEVAELPLEDAVANSTLALNKRLNLQEVEIVCPPGVWYCSKRFPFTGLYDADNKVAQTCPRRALAAKAAFTASCREGVGCTLNLDPYRGQPPSIQLCCGIWIHDDVYSKSWPTVRDYNTGLVLPTMTGAELAAPWTWKDSTRIEMRNQGDFDFIEDPELLKTHKDWVFRKVLQPDAWQFNNKIKECSLWGPQTEPEFQYWYQMLLEIQIDEEYETKESNEPREMWPKIA
ncbi:hypothetical protein H2200_009401 [Cladophialophora chaetospira]|uniref:Uncharacterized protein n=1 Tax=Cladophialophora chaetospira TaxID=386627 RepID=A0AA38X4D8_9EURO|nr:hypothetical protein H2200_009401 [Cladophialophora chaetospira]